MKNWFSCEGIATHFSGYATYATIWFNGSEVVAIEPHSMGHCKTGKVDYYNRVMRVFGPVQLTIIGLNIMG